MNFIFKNGIAPLLLLGTTLLITEVLKAHCSTANPAACSCPIPGATNCQLLPDIIA